VGVGAPGTLPSNAQLAIDAFNAGNALTGGGQPFVQPNALPIDTQAIGQDTQEEFQPFGTFNRFLRTAPGFQQSGNFVQDALRSRFEDIRSQFLLNSVSNPNLSFTDFLNARGGVGRGDATQLRQQLNQLSQLLPLDLSNVVGGIDPNQVRAVQNFRDNPKFQRDAALQLTLADIAPHLRETARTMANRQFTDFLSDRPEQQNNFLGSLSSALGF